MKKLIPVLVLITSLSFNIYGQKGFEIGIHEGVNSIWLVTQNTYGDPELSYLAKFGHAGMISLGYKIKNNVGISSGLGYTLRGQKYEGKQFSSMAYRDISLLYLQIPVLIKFTAGEKSIRFHFLLGPQIGYLLNAEQEYTRDGEPVNTVINNSIAGKKNITDRFQKTDVSLILDLGQGFSLTNNYFKNLYLNFGLRFNIGLTDINTINWRIDDIDGSYHSSKNYSIGLNIGLSYLFVK